MECQGFVGPERWINARPKIISRDFFVMRQIVHRIIRRANGGDVEFFEKAARAEIWPAQ